VILILGDDDFALELVFQDMQQLFIRDASRHGHHAYLASEIAFQQYLGIMKKKRISGLECLPQNISQH